MAKHRGRAFWEKIITDYERTAKGRTLCHFAKERGLPPGSLYRWRAKLDREREARGELVQAPSDELDLAPEAEATRFIPMVLPAPSESVALRVQLTDPPALEILDPERVPADWLAALLGVLAEVKS